MNLVLDLDEIARLTEARAAEFAALRRLEDDDDLDDASLDAQIDAIAGPIVAAIDCTQCANCCRSLQVALTMQDAARLARGFDVPVSAIITQYVDRAQGRAAGEWGVFAARPCAFLKGSLCSIYDQRPESCRMYPQFTPDFRWTLDHTISGAGSCPIIYNVLSAVVEAFRDQA